MSFVPELKILEYTRKTNRCSYCQQYFKDRSTTDDILKHTDKCISNCENSLLKSKS